MALHTDLPIYRTGVQLLDLAIKAQAQMPRGVKRSLGDKIAIAMNLRLPISLFRRPALSATIVVPANQAPMEITPEIQTNIAQVLQEQLGITVHVTAQAPEHP